MAAIKSSLRIPENACSCLAPAKLNLDLRIVGRRADGYHLLESVFTLIALYDCLHILPNHTGNIVLHTPTEDVLPENDLCYRAAKLLQQHCAVTKQGADIWLEKYIPVGGGLGGGSSDAALVLMMLNQLWHCGLDKAALIKLGVRLGADVPFFIFGESAFVCGIGENLSPMVLLPQWYVIIKPPVHVSTAAIFSHENLTRNSKPSIMPIFETPKNWRNDMQHVVLSEYFEVKVAFDALAEYGQPMMSGSGACVFLRFDDETQAQTVYQQISTKHQAYCVVGLKTHPFYG
ncbi:4-(cytidine 5'-diphospho)-2-C-methyl-D-erythritol kinase [Stenoxybacter acetivorans]|uniref:4-(cytidine 5'-diphospho)-2-C-methyl-D-erythritol kinase n=1 Tax=Stenoxybacter acetivorans TaxID=422441 RepID=UPI0006911ED3|nr:4-(cytidine 5'-diphospho)-2-C-methyl-D-erythritol kinase [Stenoxybacter acetivorans]